MTYIEPTFHDLPTDGIESVSVTMEPWHARDVERRLRELRRERKSWGDPRKRKQINN